MNQKGFSNIILAIVVVIIVTGGFGYWLFTNQPASQPTTEETTTIQDESNYDNQILSPTPSQDTTQADETLSKEVISTRPEWTTTTNHQLKIRFSHPADASVSPVEQRKTTDGVTINELIVTPSGMDPTRVHFFSTSASLEQAKNIQIYEFSNIKSSEFSSSTIDDRAGTRRVDNYLYNDCTNELTVVEKSGTVYGFHVVQCPTHSEDYDQLRRDIASSIELL
jgi:cytoskeletal protein RodZ